MTKTQERIILAAIKCFNEHGINNVLVKDIAKEAQMGLSNLNYHHKTKESLVIAVCNYLKDELNKRITSQQVLTNDGSGIELVRIYIEFALQFRFFYMDSHVILQSYPSLKPEMQLQIASSITMIKNLNYIAIGKGLMLPEPSDVPGIYHVLAQQIWLNSHFWLAQTNVRGQSTTVVSQGLEHYYNICFPYLTEKGKASFKAYIETIKLEENTVLSSTNTLQ